MIACLPHEFRMEFNLRSREENRMESIGPAPNENRMAIGSGQIRGNPGISDQFRADLSLLEAEILAADQNLDVLQRKPRRMRQFTGLVCSFLPPARP
jgi:hypothetical protein